jgi:phytanoyl-CoA hydroxylase
MENSAVIDSLSELQATSFARDGYLVLKHLTSVAACGAIRDWAELASRDMHAPLEYETDVQYPGAPDNFNAVGGKTSRRLLNVYSRDEIIRRWATSQTLLGPLQQLLAADDIVLSQCHHNCLMTKFPGYSSATLWHQDNRYWSFDRQDLISAWLALGSENKENGCLKVIPGTQQMDIEEGRFDAKKFLRPDLPINRELIDQAIDVELEAGDLLLFHSRLFHAAGRNESDRVKMSLVFSYHSADNAPIMDTRSARYPGITLHKVS